MTVAQRKSWLDEVHILPNSRYPARTHSYSLISYRMFG